MSQQATRLSRFLSYFRRGSPSSSGVNAAEPSDDRGAAGSSLLENDAGFLVEPPSPPGASKQQQQSIGDSPSKKPSGAAAGGSQQDDDSKLPPLGSLPDLHGRVSTAEGAAEGAEGEDSGGGAAEGSPKRRDADHHGSSSSLPPGVPGVLLGVFFSAIYGICVASPKALVASVTALFIAGYVAENLFAVLVAAPHFHRCESCGHTVIRIPASRHGGFSGIQVPVWGPFQHNLLRQRESRRRRRSSVTGGEQATGNVPPPALGEPHHHQE